MIEGNRSLVGNYKGGRMRFIERDVMKRKMMGATQGREGFSRITCYGSEKNDVKG